MWATDLLKLGRRECNATVIGLQKNHGGILVSQGGRSQSSEERRIKDSGSCGRGKDDT